MTWRVVAAQECAAMFADAFQVREQLEIHFGCSFRRTEECEGREPYLVTKSAQLRNLM
jgi:hypothetical protein